MRCKANRSLPLRRRIRRRFTYPTTIPPWSTGRGPIRITRPITGRHRPISAMASLRPGLPSAPDMRSAVGGQEVIGAAISIGAAAATTSTLPRPPIGPHVRSAAPVAATDGSPASIIDRLPEIEVNATSAAAAAIRCSNPAQNPARNQEAAEPMSGKAIAPTKEQVSRITAKASGRVRRRDRLIVQRTRDRRTGQRAPDRRIAAADAVEAAACARAAVAGVALWRAVAAVAVAAVAAAAVAADGGPILGLSTTLSLSGI